MKTLLYCSILIVLSNHAKILTIEGFKRVLLGGEKFTLPIRSTTGKNGGGGIFNLKK